MSGRQLNPVKICTLRGAGLSLGADVVGNAQEPDIVFLHGGGQTRRSWRRALLEADARGYRAVALDLRGHGDSDWSTDGTYSLEAFSSDVSTIIEQLGGGPVLVGASLGGLVGLTMTAKTPPLLSALILVDVTPRIEAAGAAEISAFMQSAPQGFASVQEAADAVAAYLPHRERPKDTSGLSRNLRLRGGRYYWHWDPALLRMSKNAAARVATEMHLQDLARALTLPTLLIRGGRSRIVSDDTAREFLGLVKHAERIDIADAHHMVAGDANDAFNDAIFGFIERRLRSKPPG